MVKQGVYVADRRRGNGPLAAADGINEQRTSRRLRFRAESRCAANFFAACVRHTKIEGFSDKLHKVHTQECPVICFCLKKRQRSNLLVTSILISLLS